MGLVKSRLILEQEQGWRFVDGASACYECVEEPFLKQWVQHHASEYACSYCNRASMEAPMAVLVNDLFAFIDEGLRFEYEDALNWYPYDNEEKTLVGRWSDSNELADDLELFNNDGLHADFADSFENRMFCPSDPFGLSESEAFISGWERFVLHVKHRTRYYFPVDPAAQPEGGHWSYDGLSVSEVPAYLGEAVRALQLVREAGRAEVFFRARLSKEGETYQSATELGTVPNERASMANRMSPAGIAMFYGADDWFTAIAEVYDESKDETQAVKASVGAFSASRPLHIIDLSGQISLPSLFDPATRHLREKVRLLTSFARAIAQPIQKDGLEHIEYIPTQIVTEYFRHAFADQGVSIDGIIYLSSRNPGHVCYVLFVDNEHCVDAEDCLDDGILRLVLAQDAVRVSGPGLARILHRQGTPLRQAARRTVPMPAGTTGGTGSPRAGWITPLLVGEADAAAAGEGSAAQRAARSARPPQP